MISSRRHPALLLAGLLLFVVAAAADKPQPTPEETTLTRVGQTAPDIRLTTLAGETFELAALRGRVVLVNYWATWCPPCRQEMPHLRDEIWARFGSREDFAMVSIAREESLTTIAPFVAEHGYRWPFAADVDRRVYAQYAEAFIPRNYVIDRDGKIIYQGQGYEEKEFAAMVDLIARQLAETP